MSESNVKVWLFGSSDPYHIGDSALSDLLQIYDSAEDARKAAHAKLNSDEIRWAEMVYVEHNEPTTALAWDSRKNKWEVNQLNVEV